MRIENQIFSNLIVNENYARKVVPFLNAEYFTERTDRILFEEYEKFFIKYGKLPNKEILKIEVGNRTDVTEEQVKLISSSVDDFSDGATNEDWLVESTEKFCKDKAVYNAIIKSIKIIDGKDKNHNQDAIVSLLSDALAVSFDSHVGHDYIENADDRYDFYHRVEEKIPFDIDLLNKITNGGLSKKTLNIILAGTGVGKSLAMCHFASSFLMQGKNVLYITMEMAEEKIAERIDANLLELSMESLKVTEKRIFDSRIEKIKNKTNGKLIVKEYPTASAHSGHFRALIEELKMKRDFKPDVIFVDYLNICASQRLRMGANVNSYTYIKSIAEELRGLAVESNVPIVSATQTTRSGYSNSDVGLEDTSESFGLPATADFMFALISSEEMEGLNQLMVKQLKNRYNDPAMYRRFVVGIDRSKMKLYDVEQDAQEGLIEDKPVMDNSNFGERDSDFYKKKSKFSKKDFEGFA
jgi:replicative DNA helicase